MAEISIVFACGVLAGAWLILRLANSRRGININPPPTYARPPAPPGPPPMADTTYGCDEHYYGGCPNCSRGYTRGVGGTDAR